MPTTSTAKTHSTPMMALRRRIRSWFRAGNAALHLWRAGTVPRLLGVLLGAGALLLMFGRLAFGLFCGTLAAALWPLLAARRAAAALRRGAFGVAMAGLTLAGRYTFFQVSASSYYKVVVIRVPLQGQNATIDKVLWIGLNLLPQDGFGKAPTTALCF